MASLVPCVAGKHFFQVLTWTRETVDRRVATQSSERLASKRTVYTNVRWHSECANCTPYPRWTCTCLSPVFCSIEWLEIASRLFAVTAVFDTSQVTGTTWNEFTARFHALTSNYCDVYALVPLECHSWRNFRESSNIEKKKNEITIYTFIFTCLSKTEILRHLNDVLIPFSRQMYTGYINIIQACNKHVISM